MFRPSGVHHDLVADFDPQAFQGGLVRTSRGHADGGAAGGRRAGGDDRGGASGKLQTQKRGNLVKSKQEAFCNKKSWTDNTIFIKIRQDVQIAIYRNLVDSMYSNLLLN